MHAFGEQIRSILARRLDRTVSAVHPVVGGDINRAYRAETADGPLFVKTRERAAAGTYRQEAAGLGWLAEAPGGPPTPRIALLHDPLPGDATHDPAEPRFLALEWIERGHASPTSDERFGRALAALHATPAEAFGAAPPRAPGDRTADPAQPNELTIADLRLPAEPTPTFAEFWARQRILPLTELAVAAGAFDASDLAAMHRLAERLPALVGPAEPPARTHGDLWGGNVLADHAGTVYLIDPLAHGSHREVDLATLRVFGGPSERCFAAYDEVLPLADGWQERQPLMQLGIILLHVVLFGGPYVSSARRLAAHYD